MIFMCLEVNLYIFIYYSQLLDKGDRNMSEVQELKKAIHRFQRVRKDLTKDKVIDVVISLGLGEDAFDSLRTIVDDAFLRSSSVSSDSIVSRIRVVLVLRGENLHI